MWWNWNWRTVRKTLTFWNIIQEQRKESWAESKSIVARDINKVMPEIQLHQILLKIERAHRSTTESHSKYRPIIVRFSNWDFSEDIKSAFIKALKDENRIYVSQMYSPAITFCQNDAMKKRHELWNKDKNIQTYVKYPATFKKPGDPKDSVYQEF